MCNMRVNYEVNTREIEEQFAKQICQIRRDDSTDIFDCIDSTYEYLYFWMYRSHSDHI